MANVLRIIAYTLDGVYVAGVVARIVYAFAVFRLGRHPWAFLEKTKLKFGTVIFIFWVLLMTSLVLHVLADLFGK